MNATIQVAGCVSQHIYRGGGRGLLALPLARGGHSGRTGQARRDPLQQDFFTLFMTPLACVCGTRRTGHGTRLRMEWKHLLLVHPQHVMGTYRNRRVWPPPPRSPCQQYDTHLPGRLWRSLDVRVRLLSS